MTALNQITSLRLQISERMPNASAELAQKLKTFVGQLDLLENSKPGQDLHGFKRMNNDLASLFNLVNESDLPPTSQASLASIKAKSNMELILIAWIEFKKKDIAALNQQLIKEGLAALQIK